MGMGPVRRTNKQYKEASQQIGKFSDQNDQGRPEVSNAKGDGVDVFKSWA